MIEGMVVLVLLFLLILCNVPIAISIAAVAIVGMLWSSGLPGLYNGALSLFDGANQFPLNRHPIICARWRVDEYLGYLPSPDRFCIGSDRIYSRGIGYGECWRLALFCRDIRFGSSRRGRSWIDSDPGHEAETLPSNFCRSCDVILGIAGDHYSSLRSNDFVRSANRYFHS